MIKKFFVSILVIILVIIAATIGSPANSANMFGIHIVGEGEDLINVQILSAIAKNQPIQDAEVIFQKDGSTSITGKTDAAGRAVVQVPFSDYGDNLLMIVKKDGYSPLVAKCPCNGVTYAISPHMRGNLDGIRVVLNWNQEEMDVSSYFISSDGVVFESENDKVSSINDGDEHAIQTIEIPRITPGVSYIYAVRNRSSSSGNAHINLPVSDPRVFVYVGQTLVRMYKMDRDDIGKIWIVFSIDENGIYQEIDMSHDLGRQTDVDDDQVISYAKNFISASKTAEPNKNNGADITEKSISAAKKLNLQAERLYKNKDIEGAIILYRQAIAIYPAFGQAYSNLGLAFRVSGLHAEAIWADRKAIALASGKNAHITRANAYYDIGRIYEASDQYIEARKHYELANTENPKPDYDQAIERIINIIDNITVDLKFVDIPGKSWKMMAHDVTVHNYLQFVNATGYKTVAEAQQNFPCSNWPKNRPGTSWRDPGFYQTSNNPVTCISYKDAEAFANWVRSSTKKLVRIPTLDEWQYASRGGKNTKYWWGDKINCSNARYAALGPNQECYAGSIGTVPVGSYKPNPYGLYDMPGNVSNWTSTTCDNNAKLITGMPPWIEDQNKAIRSIEAYCRYVQWSGNERGFRLVQDQE